MSPPLQLWSGWVVWFWLRLQAVLRHEARQPPTRTLTRPQKCLISPVNGPWQLSISQFSALIPKTAAASERSRQAHRMQTDGDANMFTMFSVFFLGRGSFSSQETWMKCVSRCRHVSCVSSRSLTRCRQAPSLHVLFYVIVLLSPKVQKDREY